MKKEQRITIATYLILALGVFLRLYALGRIPYGLNQDEASIGYEAFTLATYGTDRYGHPWPIYPITWGSGGGSPLMIYLAVLTTKLFGVNVWSLRLTPAVLGCATVVLFYFLVNKVCGKQAGLFAAILIVVNPWHLMMSRWELDCNTLPFWLVAAVCSFICGAHESWEKAPDQGGTATIPERYRKMDWYLCSAALFAICIYAYGSATVVVPLALICMAVYALRIGRMNVRQLVAAIVVFVVLLLPIGAFYLVNYLNLPDVETAFFSITKFTGDKSVFYSFDATLPGHMWESLQYLLRFFTFGSKDTEIICSQIPGYGTMYRFTFPLTFLGLYVMLHDLRLRTKGGSSQDSDGQSQAGQTEMADVIMLALFVCSLLFSLFIELNISRMAMFLIPLLYFQVRGWTWIIGRQQIVAAGVTAVICIGGLFFLKDYFGEKYRSLSAESFMPGYGEAILYADELAGDGQTVYSTYAHVAAPYMVALYYLQIPPDELNETVQWREEGAEFLIADAFGKFVFGLPEDIGSDAYKDDILILHREEWEAFSEEMYEQTAFGNFAVLY